MKLAANLNLALVYPKFDENLKAINAATAALELDPKNEKAFFRRADARVSTKDYEQAKNDFKKVIEINSVCNYHDLITNSYCVDIFTRFKN